MATPKKGSPFAALEALKASLPPGEAARETSAPAAKSAPSPFAGKLVVAKTRKGRGGKTVTTLAGLAASDAELEVLAKELRHALGIGVTVEERQLVAQGEQQDRVKAWLETKGAKKIVVGS